MKKTTLILMMALYAGALFAQKKTTTSATVSFDATTSLDALAKASNKTVIAAVDTKTGAVQFEANVKNFAFGNPMIQEHFNGEKWLNSDAHPSFTFKGNVVDPASVNFEKDGSYKTEVEGTLKIKGTEKKIKVHRLIRAEGVTFKQCPTCGGSGQMRKVVNTMLGQMVSTTTCGSCGGSGQIVDKRPAGVDSSGLVSKEDLISVKIPAGVGEGVQLAMQGKGNEAPGGGVAGDLLIVIEEAEDKVLKRDGNNIIYDLHISFIDAAIGTSIEVPAIGGKVRIKIEPGTQSGKILRLRGKGLKDLNGYGTGDQLIYVNVWTPKKLTSEEKAKLESLKDAPNFQPHPDANEKGFFERMKEYFN